MTTIDRSTDAKRETQRRRRFTPRDRKRLMSLFRRSGLPKLAAATNKTATGLLPHDYALLTEHDDEDTTEDAQPEIVTDREPSPSS